MVKNIIITEKQLKKITEINLSQGVHEFEKSWSLVFDYINFEFTSKKIKKLIEKYFAEKLGIKIGERDMEKIIGDFPYIKGNIPELKNEDVLSNLAYFLAKKSEDWFKLGNLGCLKWRDEIYIFFDLELQESIGHIKIQESNNRDYYEVPVVYTSSLDKEIKGQGYGKEMYLAILDDVPMLGSDKFLSKESLNIWVNVLPKYAYVIAKLEDSSQYVSMMGKYKPHFSEVERYFATKNKEIFKYNLSD